MGVCRALALFGDAKQAMGEGKSGPVETGLTGPVATALFGQQATSTVARDGLRTARVWSKFTRFETVSGYVTLITIYNPSR